MILATHGDPDLVDQVYGIIAYLPLLKVVAFVLFLFAAIRLSQSQKNLGSTHLSWGAGLVLVALVFVVAINYAVVELSYSLWLVQQQEQHAGMYLDATWQWWEPWLWWGKWVLLYVGMGLMSFGFFEEGRRIARGGEGRNFTPQSR